MKLKCIKKWVKICLTSGIIILIISFVFIQLLIFLGARNDYNIDSKYLLILGSGLKGEKPLKSLYSRLQVGVEYLRKNKTAIVIVSGGQGSGETITEAEAMKRYLVENEIADNRIIKEDKSTSTFENIIFSKKILEDLEGKKNHEISLITSGFHLFRSEYLARKNGLIVHGIGAKTPFFVLIHSLLREYLTVVKAFILGK